MTARATVYILVQVNIQMLLAGLIITTRARNVVVAPTVRGFRNADIRNNISDMDMVGLAEHAAKFIFNNELNKDELLEIIKTIPR